MHTIAVKECLDSYEPNPIFSGLAPDISQSETSLPRKTRRILAQLRAGKSPILKSYLHTIDPVTHPSPACPLCKLFDYTTQHLFSCPKLNTILTVRDLWHDPVAELLQQWTDVQAAAGGGQGSRLTRNDLWKVISLVISTAHSAV